MQISINLDRYNRSYIPGEAVEGVVEIVVNGPSSHSGIKLVVDGTVNLQLSPRSAGVFEAFYSSIKPEQLLGYEFEVAKPGKLRSGKTEYPFKFKLKPKKGSRLHETYHGVYINVQYLISVEIARSMLAKNLKKTVEFIVKCKPKKEIEEVPVEFTITPDKLKNVSKSRTGLPQFKIRGMFNSQTCNVDRPFGGWLLVEESDQPIKSIELQFVRVETAKNGDSEIREATEVQNIQIADGDVMRNTKIPMYMIFPRLFTCISTSAKSWKVSFEVNVVVLFRDNQMLTENIPIKLIRVEVDSPF